jgi:hypothetical protein
MHSRAVGLVVVVLLGFAPGRAPAQSSRVLLVDPDRELESAVRATFRGWDVGVVVESTEPSRAPSAPVDARSLAKRRSARAVVWVSLSEGRTSLLTYDSSDDRMVVRALSTSPPFDEATAASLALSIKTQLRHGRAPPQLNRTPGPEEYWLHFAASGGMRSTGTIPRNPELRLGLGASAWPWSFGGRWSQVGFGVDVTSGPGVAVEAPSFTGRWTETLVLATVRARTKLSGAVDLGAALGVGFDVTNIRGTIVRLHHETRESRLNGVFGAHLEVGYRPSSAFRIAVRPGLVEPLNRQAYLVDGEPVARMEPLMLGVMAVLELGLL